MRPSVARDRARRSDGARRADRVHDPARASGCRRPALDIKLGGADPVGPRRPVTSRSSCSPTPAAGSIATAIGPRTASRERRARRCSSISASTSRCTRPIRPATPCSRRPCSACRSTGHRDRDEGVLAIETVGAMELELLGVTRGADQPRARADLRPDGDRRRADSDRADARRRRCPRPTRRTGRRRRHRARSSTSRSISIARAPAASRCATRAAPRCASAIESHGSVVVVRPLALLDAARLSRRRSPTSPTSPATSWRRESFALRDADASRSTDVPAVGGRGPSRRRRAR